MVLFDNRRLFILKMVGTKNMERQGKRLVLKK